MSSIRFLRTFVAIAESGSFTAAAQRIALTPAAIGAQMKALEEELGRQLFQRVNRGAVITAAGSSLLPRARRVIAEYERMLAHEAQDGQIAGTMAIGSITSALGLLAGTVLTLKAAHPQLDIKLVNGRRPELMARVVSREIDAAVFVESSARAPENTEWLPLYSEPLMLVASSEVAGARSTALQLLKSQPFIRFDHTGATGPKVEQILRRSGLRVRELVEMDSVASIIELVRQGAGVAIVPLQRGCGWEADKSLRVLPLPGRKYARNIGMLRSLERPFLTEVLRDELVRRVGGGH
jgi:DNA-binding transcriptional LysR family regulator